MPDPAEPDRASIEQGMLEMVAFFAELRNQAEVDATSAPAVAKGDPVEPAAEQARGAVPPVSPWLPGLLEVVGTQLPQEERAALLRAVDTVVVGLANSAGRVGERSGPDVGGSAREAVEREPVEGDRPRVEEAVCRGGVEAVAFPMVEGA